jgi:hypothetical protein
MGPLQKEGRRNRMFPYDYGIDPSDYELGDVQAILKEISRSCKAVAKKTHRSAKSRQRKQ